MANIALNKPSGGQLILSPEDGTSTETVTIPSVGVGKVLQVVQGELLTSFSTTSGAWNWTDTGLTASITPASSGSKILVRVSYNLRNSVDGYNIYTALNRNGTLIGAGNPNGIILTAATTFGGRHGTHNAEVLDTPATTSTLTYKVQMCTEGNTAYLNDINNATFQPRATITLMEVAA